MSRAPAAPPQLPGYEFVQHIGGGGFADVYLYEQQMLGRKVAVKVLLAGESSPSVRAQFDAESTLMAALSTHPHIVSIYDASIAGDGRPYLIMEYCSRPTLSQRYKREAIPVADALTIGIQIGGAVETAHRAGILHRDIKPANVLTTDYNRPALTDFGISVVTGAAPGAEAVGMSIPWSPPEMLADQPDGDQRADVYSLAATVYTLLARRSPFERPGGPNTAVDLVNRIQRTPLPPVGRSDVPASLERVLSRGLAKDPAARWTSALQFARALQDVQAEQGWPLTQVDVFDENPGAAQAALTAEDDGRTRIRGLTTIQAQPPVATEQRTTPVTDAATQQEAERTALRPGRVPDPLAGRALSAPAPVDTMRRPPEPETGPPPEIAQSRSRWPWLVVAGTAAAVIAVVVVVLATRGTTPPPLPADTEPTGAGQQEAVDLGVPAPADLAATRQGDSWVFTWTNPDPQPGDSYQWRRTDTDDPAGAQSVTSPTATVAADRACLSVVLVRANGQYSADASVCTEDG